MTTFYSQLRTPKLKMIIQQEFIARPEDKVKYYTNTIQHNTMQYHAMQKVPARPQQAQRKTSSENLQSIAKRPQPTQVINICHISEIAKYNDCLKCFDRWLHHIIISNVLKLFVHPLESHSVLTSTISYFDNLSSLSLNLKSPRGARMLSCSSLSNQRAMRS